MSKGRLAELERRMLLRREGQTKAREEESALEARLAETQALGEARGAAFDRGPQRRGEGRKPMRRLTGLEWLHGKGRISDAQLAAGLRYGAAFRRATGEARIRSILDREPGGGGQLMTAVLASAEATAAAGRRLAGYRGLLFEQEGLVRACDAICGQELTPREASVNGRTAEGLEAVLKVALDLLGRAGGKGERP